MKIKEIIHIICEKAHIKIDHKYITFGICVMIAAILWFLNAFNKEYSSELIFNVAYENLPRNKYIVSELPETITITVSAKGFSLLAMRMGSNNIITVDLERLEHENGDDFILYLNDVKEKVLTHFTSDIHVNNFRPNKIDFKFLPSVQKMVKICPRVNYTLDPYYMLKNLIECTPDSVLVSSSKLVLDTLKCVYTEKWNAGEISYDINKKLFLQKENDFDIKDNETTVSIHVERFTEAKQMIPIKIYNKPRNVSRRVVLFPSEVEVNYNVGLSHFGNIRENDFEFSVDYNKLEDNSKLDVELIKHPLFIKDLKYTPHKVEFVIESGN